LAIGGYRDDSYKGAAWVYNYVNVPLEFINNNLIVINGTTTILNTTMLKANDSNHIDSELIFFINNLQHGKFERTNDWSQVSNFSQLDVNNMGIQFTHDGNGTAPSYSVNVTDGEYNVGPSFPNINFSTDTTGVPVIVIKPITVNVGQRVVITTTMVKGTVNGGVDPTLVFRVNNVACGYFENINSPGVAIYMFTQQQVIDGQIRFVRTGEGTNCFEITVDNGTYRSKPGFAGLLSSSENYDYLAPMLASIGVVVAGVVAVLIVRAKKPALFHPFRKSIEEHNTKRAETLEPIKKAAEMQNMGQGDKRV
jgi:hypothetical protein